METRESCGLGRTVDPNGIEPPRAKSTSIIAGMKFKSNLLCRSAPQSANFPPTFPLKGNAVESMQRTLRGRHSVRRELRIFEILEALLAREIIERSSFATPSRWIGSIQSSIEGHYDLIKITLLYLAWNSIFQLDFSKFFLKNCSIKESGRSFFFYEIYEIICVLFTISSLYKKISFLYKLLGIETFHMKYYYLFIYIYTNNILFVSIKLHTFFEVSNYFFVVFSYHLHISVKISHGISFDIIFFMLLSL